MTTFLTYRDGTDDIETRIKAAVALFYTKTGRLPSALVVHKSELADAKEAVAALNLAVPVQGSGGALRPEIWLALPEGETPEQRGLL